MTTNLPDDIEVWYQICHVTEDGFHSLKITTELTTKKDVDDLISRGFLANHIRVFRYGRKRIFYGDLK